MAHLHVRGKAMNKNLNKFPPGWDEAKVKRVIEFYENQSDEESIAEAEAALGKPRG